MADVQAVLWAAKIAAESLLEAVLGKTHRTEFLGGRLETWPWEPLTEASGESRGYATGP